MKSIIYKQHEKRKARKRNKICTVVGKAKETGPMNGMERYLETLLGGKLRSRTIWTVQDDFHLNILVKCVRGSRYLDIDRCCLDLCVPVCVHIAFTCIMLTLIITE